MSATIRVETGISAGTNYWIDRPVLRIGSDPSCEICLPSAELPPHAVTLEYKGGTYRAYNRGAGPISIAGSSVAPGASSLWNENDSILLPGELRLQLAVEGDPRPAPRPDVERHGDPRADLFCESDLAAGAEAAPPKAKSPSNAIVQLGVIALCVLGVVVFLTMGGSGEVAIADRPRFESIVESSLESPAPPLRDLVHRLQYAEVAVVRGHEDAARERFEKLRDQLLRALKDAEEESRTEINPILDYVEYRLGTLD